MAFSGLMQKFGSLGWKYQWYISHYIQKICTDKNTCGGSGNMVEQFWAVEFHTQTQWLSCLAKLIARKNTFLKWTSKQVRTILE